MSFAGVWTTSASSRPPDAVNGVSGTATEIAAGRYHSCAIRAGTGNAICWGRNDYAGQLAAPDAVNGVSGTAIGHRGGVAATPSQSPRPTSRRRLQLPTATPTADAYSDTDTECRLPLRGGERQPESGRPPKRGVGREGVV